MPPGNRRAVGHGIEKDFPAGGILDLFQLLRKVEIIPADDAVLDESLAGFGHLLVFFLRLQKLARIAHRDGALDELLFVALPAGAVNEIVIQGSVFVGMLQVQRAGFDPALDMEEEQGLVKGNTELVPSLLTAARSSGSKKPVGADLSTPPSFSLKCSMASTNFRTPGSPWKVSAFRIGLTRF